MTSASASPLLRWYFDGPSTAAPSALMCTSRRTPAAWHAAMTCRGSSTWERANVSPPCSCRMPTRFTTVSTRADEAAEAAPDR